MSRETEKVFVPKTEKEFGSNSEDVQGLIEVLRRERERWDCPKHPVYQGVNRILRRVCRDDWSFSEDELRACFTKHVTSEKDAETSLQTLRRRGVRGEEN